MTVVVSVITTLLTVVEKLVVVEVDISVALPQDIVTVEVVVRVLEPSSVTVFVAEFPTAPA